MPTEGLPAGLSQDLTRERMLQLLADVGALIQDSHIVYTSGKHGSAYVNKDAIYPHTQLTSHLCLEIAKLVSALQIEVVLAPAIGGVILSQWVAYHLSRLSGYEVLGIYAEKENNTGEFVITRGFDGLCRSKRTLIVEDILNTGGSVRKVMHATLGLGSKLVGVAALCVRGGLGSLGKTDSGHWIEADGLTLPLYALAELPLDAWDAADCPLCRSGVAINTQIGKGREYLKAFR
jgi:orotate phosphoribosyltransferase